MTKTELQRFECDNCTAFETIEQGLSPEEWGRIPASASGEMNVNIAETTHLCPDCVKTLRKLVKPGQVLMGETDDG